MAGIPHPDPISGASYSAIELLPDDAVALVLDQRALPTDEIYLRVDGTTDLVRAIREMWIRGAPALGVAGAYGVVLAAREAASDVDFERRCDELRRARPTAVNLAWAVDRMLAKLRDQPQASRHDRVQLLAAEARALHRQDVAANRRMGELGQARVPDGAVVLTHCNAGALATGGYGTALGVLRAAKEAGKRIQVLAGETRPWLQGARLTAWELSRDQVPVTVVTDNSVASRFKRSQIDLAVVGADRVARNGDVANKIGTYSIACLAQMHQRPFYVAAPVSTLDPDTPDGSSIVIEQRAPEEITRIGVTRLVADGIPADNPAFDVTPAELITALFTERGVASPLSEDTLGPLLQLAR